MQKRNCCKKKNTCDDVYIVPTKPFTSKMNKNKARIYSLITLFIWQQESKHGFYRSEDFVKKLWVNLKEHVTEIINCEKGNSASDKDREKSYKKQKSVTYAKKNSTENLMRTKVFKKSAITAVAQEKTKAKRTVFVT